MRGKVRPLAEVIVVVEGIRGQIPHCGPFLLPNVCLRIKHGPEGCLVSAAVGLLDMRDLHKMFRKQGGFLKARRGGSGMAVRRLLLRCNK